MVSLFEKNLAVLAARQPELAARVRSAREPADAELLASRMGPPYLRAGGVLVCSSVDPMAEGERLAADAPPGPLAVLGFGLGYHLEPLTDRDLVVWEPDPGLLRVALGARDLTHLLPNMRLALTRSDLGAVAGRGVLLHPTTARLHPDQARALGRLANGPSVQSTRPERPRVLVVPPVYGGSLDVATWCGQALQALGCDVLQPPLASVEPLYQRLRTAHPNSETARRATDSLLGFLGQMILAEAEGWRPHLVLALAQAPLEPKVLDRLGELGAVRAFWFVEDFRVRPYYRQVATAYDHFFHIQGRAMEAQLRGLGANAHHLPLAAHPAVHRPLQLSDSERKRWSAPVGFMGQGYPNRVRLLSELIRQVQGLRIWGTGWPDSGPLAKAIAEAGRRISAQEVARVYNACEVVLNLHTSELAAADPEALDYVNPRTFEVAACGGFQIKEKSAALGSVLAQGQEIAVFSKPSELPGLIKHYLARPQERAAMAAAARRRVLAQHTYYHRMETMLTTCLGPGPQNAETQPDEEALDLMLERLASGA